MSKIICDVCGTSYPETAEQCPICGCVRPADTNGVADGAEKKEGYTYVKGGRFSKANVRKRTGAPVQPIVHDSAEEEENKQTNKGLIITAVCLVVAILLLLVYVFFQFFGGTGARNNNGSGNKSTTPPSTESQNAECRNLYLDVKKIVFAEPNESRMLYVTTDPESFANQVKYKSSDESVATVNSKGKVTAIAPGIAEITITCGEISATCEVECAFEIENTDETTDETTDEPTEETIAEVLELNRKEFTLQFVGDSWMLYSGKIPVEDITWSSSRSSVCTVENGKVVAVSSFTGRVTITAEYKGQKAVCEVLFNLDGANSGVAGNGGVSADGEG